MRGSARAGGEQIYDDAHQVDRDGNRNAPWQQRTISQVQQNRQEARHGAESKRRLQQAQQQGGPQAISASIAMAAAMATYDAMPEEDEVAV
jgi:hypothetical protein